MNPSLENIYDDYSTILYGIAVEISQNSKLAEVILIKTFKIFHSENLIAQTYPSHFIILIKVLIKVAHEHIKPKTSKNNLSINKYTNTPILTKLLFNQMNSEDFNVANKSNKEKLTRSIREELNFFRTLSYLA